MLVRTALAGANQNLMHGDIAEDSTPSPACQQDCSTLGPVTNTGDMVRPCPCFSKSEQQVGSVSWKAGYLALAQCSPSMRVLDEAGREGSGSLVMPVERGRDRILLGGRPWLWLRTWGGGGQGLDVCNLMPSRL